MAQQVGWRLLGAQMPLGSLWLPSEENPADDLARGRQLRQPGGGLGPVGPPADSGTPWRLEDTFALLEKGAGGPGQTTAAGYKPLPPEAAARLVSGQRTGFSKLWRPRALELFSGAGHLSQALQQRG